METTKTAPTEDASKMLVDLQAVFTVVIVLTMATGFVLKYFWLWFVVPLGVMPIGFAHAIGVSILFRVFASPGGQKSKISNGETLGLGLGFLAMLFGIGYLCHYLM